MPVKIATAVTTTKGYHRDHNEDNFLCNGLYLKPTIDNKSLKRRGKLPILYAVCDGLGGLSHGREAASIVIHSLKYNYRHLSTVHSDSILYELDLLIKKTNLNVYQATKSGSKMGSTLALVYLHLDKIYLANVGDSRIYQIKNREVKQLSVDHTQTHCMRSHGLDNREKSSNENVLSQYIGMSPSKIIIEPHYETLAYSDMLLLLCSDGLTEALSNEDITNLVCNNQNMNLRKISSLLISQAIKQGAKDNITAMLIEIK